MKEYDLIIIGSGPGGYVAALRGAQKGLKTAIIEKDKIGGVCLNWGCIPSKSLITSGKLYQKIKKGKQFGLEGVDFKAIKPNWISMNKRGMKIVKKLTSGVNMLLKKNGVDIIMGEGEVLNSQKVVVDGVEYLTKNLIIATGTHYNLPQFLKNNIYTPKTIYSIETVPKEITIVGAGSIGVEFALLFSNLDVKVTLIDQNDQFMPYLDKDVKQFLIKKFKKDKIDLKLGYKIIDQKGDKLLADNGGEIVEFQSDLFLWSVSREAQLKGIDQLIDQGLKLKNGFIKTDNSLKTNIDNVYAVGDINGKVMLAHTASVEGSCAIDNILGENREVDYEKIPYNLYGSIEFASVGLTEDEGIDRGYDIKTGLFPFTANGKALAEGESEGFLKIVYEKKYGEVLGVHIVSSNATDLIGEAVIGIEIESTIWDIAKAVHPHPTMVETFLEASFKGVDNPLHIL